MAHLGQDLSSYTAQDFTPIPPGEYAFEVVDSAVVDTKKGGRMIKVSCKVLGPTHAGRIVFENFVLGQDVAMSRLKSLATFGGHKRPDFIQDTEELHGLRFLGNVGVQQQEGYNPSNHIKTFKKLPTPENQVQGGYPNQGFAQPPQAQYPQAQPQYPQPQGPVGEPPFAPSHAHAVGSPMQPPTAAPGTGMVHQGNPAAYPPPPPPMQQQFPQVPTYQPPPMAQPPQAQAQKPTAPWVK